jgi:glycosyltransferase involved in cell wall biosynthesis
VVGTRGGDGRAVIHLLSSEYPPFAGGVASWCGAVAAALHTAGHPVRVYAHWGAPGADVPFTRLFGRSWNRQGHRFTAFQVRPRLREGDTVLAATWPLAAALPASMTPIVAWHGSDLTRPAVIPGRERVAARARNIVVSRFLGARLGAPSTWMPYPIEPTTPVRRGDALLTVARLVSTKGVDRVLRLGARLGRPVVVVGDGPERPALEALASTLPVRVSFLGATRDIPWEGTWALALLSRPHAEGGGEEGLGLVLLEAAARGIPTLGSRVGGIPEAATVVLDDPDHDEVPALPDPAAVQDWLRHTHGTARFLAAFEGVARAGEPARTPR